MYTMYFESVLFKANNFYINIYNINLWKEFTIKYPFFQRLKWVYPLREVGRVFTSLIMIINTSSNIFDNSSARDRIVKEMLPLTSNFEFFTD